MAMTKSQRRRVTTIIRYVVLSVWAVIAFFPIYWIISTSFKIDTQWFAWPPYYFPSPPTLSNCLLVFSGCDCTGDESGIAAALPGRAASAVRGGKG